GTRALCRLFKYVSSGYQQDIGLLDTAAARVKVLLENSAEAAIGPDGSLLFTRGATLYGATVDLAKAREPAAGGEPVPLVSRLRPTGAYQDAPFRIARDGTLMFRPGGEQGIKRRLEFRLPDGTSTPLAVEPQPFDQAISVSRDESRVLVVVCSHAKLFEV